MRQNHLVGAKEHLGQVRRAFQLGLDLFQLILSTDRSLGDLHRPAPIRKLKR